MTDIGLNTDGGVVNQETITDSRRHLPRAIRLAEQYAAGTYTSSFNVPDETVFTYLNRGLSDGQEITGTVEDVVDEKVIIDVNTHESSISDEYGQNKLTLGHEFWVKIFGGEAVEDVYRTTDQFGQPVTKVVMFDVMKLQRDLISQINNHHYGYTTRIYGEHDGDRVAVFSHLMTDPYCLAMLEAERYKREEAENEGDTARNTSAGSNTTIAGLERNDDRTTKYET